MDVLAPTTMKNAAKCDTSCELQNPVSHQNFERNLHFPREVCLLECLFIPTKSSLFEPAACNRKIMIELRCKPNVPELDLPLFSQRNLGRSIEADAT